MAFGLKTVRYKSSERRILLQNENGPCPLLAAANCLLLKGLIHLPPHCIRNDVASLEDVVNLLANQAMQAGSSSSSSSNTSDAGHHALLLDELLQILPKFQYGMDVNPKFTMGIKGYEYTRELSALDMLNIQLVHGWLMDPVHDEDVMNAVGSKTYNELVESIIHGKEAEGQLSELHSRIDDLKVKQREVRELGSFDLLDDEENTKRDEETAKLDKELEELQQKYDSVSQKAKDAALIDDFIHSTGHQLTHYGLVTLHETLNENELYVFFRNNHFGTLTKHQGNLFLLATDLGYSHTPDIVWEKLDMIDGDTELVNNEFAHCGAQAQLLASGPSLNPEQLLAQSGRNENDYQLALALSRQQEGKAVAPKDLDDQEGKLMQAATEASLRDYHGMNNNNQKPDPPATGKVNQKPEHLEMGVPLNPTPSAAATVARLPTATATATAAPSTSTPSSLHDMTTAASPTTTTTQEDADRMLAMQLSATSQGTAGEEASLRLAQQLQHEENARAAAASRQPSNSRRQQQTASPSRTRATAKASNCIIS